MTIKELDERLDLDDEVIASIAENASTMLMDLGDAKGLEYTGREQQQVMGGIWEGVMMLFGGEDETLQADYGELTQGMGQPEIDDAMNTYERLVREGSGAGEMTRG